VRGDYAAEQRVREEEAELHQLHHGNGLLHGARHPYARGRRQVVAVPARTCSARLPPLEIALSGLSCTATRLDETMHAVQCAAFIMTGVNLSMLQQSLHKPALSEAQP
jgi:hypothetical protein